MENKKGQFFIIAAFFIVLVLFGMASISTYAIVKPEPKTISELRTELNREGFKVIEYGIYNKENLENLSDNFLGEDVSKYFLQKIDNANIIYVYGDKDNLNSITYLDVNTGVISIGGAGFSKHTKFAKKGKPKIEENAAKVEVLGKNYSFKIKDNEMFYFVIVQKKGDEIFIKRSDGLKNEDND